MTQEEAYKLAQQKLLYMNYIHKDMNPNLRTLFLPRDPLPYMKPIKKPKCRSLDGVCKEDGSVSSYFKNDGPVQPQVKIENRVERKRRLKFEKLRDHKEKIKPLFKECKETSLIFWEIGLRSLMNSFGTHVAHLGDGVVCISMSLGPIGNPFADLEYKTENPKNTILVARIPYDTDEEELKKEFDIYGKIKSLRIIRDKEGRHRGYGFIEFENHKDFLRMKK